MQERIDQEFELLKKYYPSIKYVNNEGHWFLIPAYNISEGWSSQSINVAFTTPPEYPASPPYGIYVPIDLRYKGVNPNNFAAAKIAVPFDGCWGVLSWAPGDGQWRPTADLISGSNLLHWARGFAERFREGV